MRPPTKTALVADSQELFSSAIKELLQRELGFTEVISVTTFEAAGRNLAHNPAISFAVFDIEMHDIDGLASMASLRVAYPELRLAVVATSSRREQILRALSVGVHGYIPRTLTISEMVQAMQTIVSGQIYVPPTLSDVLDNTLSDTLSYLATAALHPEGNGHLPEHRDVSLTLRQQEVMQLIAEGKTNKEIARILGLAEGTVKAHVNALFRALSVHNRASVAALLASHHDIQDE